MGKPYLAFWRGFLLIAGVLAQAGPAAAQVPPHIPGTICFTPQFWCWAQAPSQPGAPCSCATPEGMVGGVLG